MTAGIPPAARSWARAQRCRCSATRQPFRLEPDRREAWRQETPASSGWRGSNAATGSPLSGLAATSRSSSAPILPWPAIRSPGDLSPSPTSPPARFRSNNGGDRKVTTTDRAETIRETTTRAPHLASALTAWKCNCGEGVPARCRFSRLTAQLPAAGAVYRGHDSDLGQDQVRILSRRVRPLDRIQGMLSSQVAAHSSTSGPSSSAGRATHS